MRCIEAEEKRKNKAEKGKRREKLEKRKTNLQPPLGGCKFWAFFTVELGESNILAINLPLKWGVRLFCVTSWAILGNFQAILGNLLGPLSGILRQFQAILGNFRQFRVILGNFGGPKPKKKKTVQINTNEAEDCTPKFDGFRPG